jgi:hypothetical protein
MHRGQTLRVEAITETRVPFNGDRNYELTPAARGHDAQRPLKVDDVVVVAQDSAPNGDMRVTLPCRRVGATSPSTRRVAAASSATRGAAGAGSP